MSVSAFVRQRVFAKGGEKPRPGRHDYRPVADQQAMAQALALLGQWHIANNLNQLAHHAHLGTLPVDGDTTARIDEAYAFVVELRQALLAALGRDVP
ncbi:MAG TPA: plasmid mobilization relaxosome protein MobC [Geminicoccaceae bacterium]|nr:plasmid mobilization relaxosome protein MobC [Geminicoccus sp.]HMU52863.1 plasmid mobilization relaxosome protein MobC [Geminicoccaceae bacterium]